MPFLFGSAGVLTAYHTFLVLLPVPRAVHLPANLGTAGLLLLACRRRGIPRSKLGLARECVSPGLRWGTALSFCAAVGVRLALAVPAGSKLLRDKRLSGLSRPEFLYRLLVHIPLATALPEEVIFRGALFGALSQERRPRTAMLGSSVAFGLWHIGPAIDRLRANRPGATNLQRATAVAGTIAATTLAGTCLSSLRVRSKGLMGPIIVHWAVNACATVGARFTSRPPRTSGVHA
ncbi:MAG TPA: CPBP family intramembrane glutamic endopeptidase [Actinomycetota bacterium]|nr:CPBP family intramembrane glutamic endopeptidase [Actinomycetota bacterium]